MKIKGVRALEIFNPTRNWIGEVEKMKRKITVIFVCMLVIASSTVVLADWEPSDGHKMHCHKPRSKAAGI